MHLALAVSGIGIVVASVVGLSNAGAARGHPASNPTAPTQTTSRVAASFRTLSACSADRVSVRSEDVGETAGLSYLGLTATNHGSACTLSGIPVFKVVTDSGQLVYHVRSRSTLHASSRPLLTIPAGATGSLTLSFTPCSSAGPPVHGRLRLTFPGGHAFAVPFDATSGCDGQQIGLVGASLGAPPLPPGFESVIYPTPGVRPAG